MSRLLLPTILALLLFACQPVPSQIERPAPVHAVDPAKSLFIEGIDHFETDHRSAVFLQLEQNFSDSAWNRRGRVLANLAGSIRLLEKQVKRQQSVIDEQKKDQLVLKRLTQENELLQEQVKVLKSLIIDLELHQP